MDAQSIDHKNRGSCLLPCSIERYLLRFATKLMRCCKDHLRFVGKKWNMIEERNCTIYSCFGLLIVDMNLKKDKYNWAMFLGMFVHIPSKPWNGSKVKYGKAHTNLRNETNLLMHFVYLFV
jgi:hypothetical protein